MPSPAKIMWKKCAQHVPEASKNLWVNMCKLLWAGTTHKNSVENYSFTHTFTDSFSQNFAQVLIHSDIWYVRSFTQNPHPLLLQPKGIKG